MERLRSVLVKQGIGLGEGLDITDKLGSAFLCDSTLFNACQGSDEDP